MYLFFDTETTGLPRNYNAPVSDSQNWPRLVQLAWVICDSTGREMASHDCIIYPDKFEIPKSASDIHRITTETATLYGFALKHALTAFTAAACISKKMVAHNIGYDENIIGAEFFRMEMPNVLTGKDRICTMKTTTDFCKIPGPYGFKWPKLAELYKVLFEKELEDAHSAAVDIRATVKCFFELKNRGIIKED